MKSKSIKRKHKPSKSISLDQFIAAYNAADAGIEEAQRRWAEAQETCRDLEIRYAEAQEAYRAFKKDHLRPIEMDIMKAHRARDKAERELNAAKMLEDIQMASQK